MSLALLWSLAVGTILPGLTALLTKEKLSPKLKTLFQALLAGVTGAVSGFLINPPAGTSQWEQIAGAILVSWVSAGATFVTGWQPTGAVAAITKATANFGIGRRSYPAGDGGYALVPTMIFTACAALAVFSAVEGLWMVLAVWFGLSAALGVVWAVLSVRYRPPRHLPAEVRTLYPPAWNLPADGHRRP